MRTLLVHLKSSTTTKPGQVEYTMNYFCACFAIMFFSISPSVFFKMEPQFFLLELLPFQELLQWESRLWMHMMKKATANEPIACNIYSYIVFIYFFFLIQTSRHTKTQVKLIWSGGDEVEINANFGWWCILNGAGQITWSALLVGNGKMIRDRLWMATPLGGKGV